MLEMLEMDFESTAEWREGVAGRYPDDARNADAASTFKRLAESVKRVSRERADQYEALWSGDNDGHRASEEKSEMLRSIHPGWETADEFIADLIERVRRREAA